MPSVSLLPAVAALFLAPLLLGVIARTKAIAVGRSGPPLLQPYRDLGKLLRKGAVYSRTSTWVLRAGPTVGLAAVLCAAALVPLGGVPAWCSFEGDLFLVACLLGLGRFAAALAALDSGSSFTAMGASREMSFGALAEPVLLLALAAIARQVGCLSLSPMYAAVNPAAWERAAPAFALLGGALAVVFLTENGRVPVDDPTTHLELTMIHEAMVLDHGGPDLALILYSGAVKLWLLGALLVGLLVPVRSGNAWVDGAAAVAGMFAFAVVTGVIECSMARWRLVRVPQLLVGAGIMSALALAVTLR